MLHLGITPKGKESNRLQLLKRLNPILVAFVVVMLLLPIGLFAGFYGELFKSRSPLEGVSMAVARISYSNDMLSEVVGTGFLIAPDKILTARHVVANKEIGESIDVSFEQAPSRMVVQATVQWKAPTEYPLGEDGTAPFEYFLTDVALLQLDEPITDIAPMSLGVSEDVETLDEIILIGYPGGDYSITSGEINSLNYQDQDLFKLDATTNSGNSGGPCLMENNQTVIGIIVGGPANPAIDGENIAIKIDNVINLMDRDGVSL